MDARKLIDSLGGCQATANILNGLKDAQITKMSRQRIWNWYKADKIPAWAQIAYSKVWKKALKD